MTTGRVFLHAIYCSCDYSFLPALFTYIGRLASLSHFREALLAPTIPEGRHFHQQSSQLIPNDLYLRTYAQIYLVKLGSIAQKKKPELSEEDKRIYRRVWTKW